MSRKEQFSKLKENKTQLTSKHALAIRKSRCFGNNLKHSTDSVAKEWQIMCS
jgi:hypothetical protein